MKAKLTTVCCFGYGLVVVLPQMIMIIAMEDMVAGTLIPTSVVMIAFAAADVLSKVCSPFIVRKISFLPSIVVLCGFWLFSYTLIVIPVSVETRLVGVVFLGLANALGVIVMCFLIPLYEGVEANTSAFQSGSNLASLVAALIYTGLTTWLCQAPRMTIAICYPLAFLSVIFYALLNHGPLKEYQTEKQQLQNGYTTVSTIDHQHKKPILTMAIYYIEFLLHVFPFVSYFYMNYCSYYITANAILTSLTFPSAPFSPRDHYQYYRLTGDIGTFLGGMELMLIMCLCSDWLDLFRIRKIWILVLLNISHVIFLLLASWYHFVISVYVVLVLCVTQGFLFGSTSVRVLTSAADCFAGSRDKGMAMVIVEIGSSVGRLVVGLLGVFVEGYLRDHCTNRLLLGRFCLARFTSSVGWNDNTQCNVN